MDYNEFIKEIEKNGTQIIGIDDCMCPVCVARRKTGDIRKPRIIPEESDDPIQQANRKHMLEAIKAGMFMTNQTQRKNKNKKKKEEEE